VDFTSNCANTSAQPEPGFGFYAAVYQDPSSGWGFMEVEGVHTLGTAITSVTDFAKYVEAANAGRTWGPSATNVYTTLQGDILTFAPNPCRHLEAIGMRLRMPGTHGTCAMSTGIAS